MTSWTDERTSLLKEGKENPDARYVLYWMQVYKRTSHNHALNKAIEIANALELPLVVYEGLKFYYPWASDRIHTFVMEGVVGKKEAFEKKGIRYLFYLQRNAKDPRNTVVKLAKDAAVLVTDDFPCFIIPEHNKHICDRADIPVYAVDSNGMIPLSRLTKEEFAARTIRPKIHKLLPDYVAPLRTPAVKIKKPQLKVDCPETEVTEKNIPDLVAQCDIDHSVPPSPLYHGGEAAGKKRLNYFVKNILPGYDTLRNKPDVDGCSRLSSYLHFGFLSAQEIYEAVEKADAPKESKDAFLEELIVRRELSYNLTRHNKNYDSLDALPEWALKTMHKHEDDKRAVTFTKKQIEEGTTDDLLWNAAQRELLATGELHNYMRMLWGKKVIEWMPSYKAAFDFLVHLNNKYSLDGRNPNSYTGILWCFGKHDRAWGPERPIFGTLRYLSSTSWNKKVNAKAYIEWTNSFREAWQNEGVKKKVVYKS